MGIYNAAGTLVAVTADQSSNFGVALLHTAAFTTPYAAAAGEYWVGFVINGNPTNSTFNLKSTGAGITANSGLTAAHYRIGWFNGTNTSLPSPLTMSSMADSGSPMMTAWFGLK